MNRLRKGWELSRRKPLCFSSEVVLGSNMGIVLMSTLLPHNNIVYDESYIDQRKDLTYELVVDVTV
jgi:hypothetical protein